MKVNKILSVLTIVIIVAMILFIPNTTLSATATPPKYLVITELRTNDEPNMGYAIGDPKTNGETGNAHKIWNILETTKEVNDTQLNNIPLKANGSKNIYCVNAGIGFSDTKKSATYNVFYDMKKEREQIKAQKGVLNALVESQIPVDEGNETKISAYNAVLALGDMIYLIDESNDQKLDLLKAAGITYSKELETYHDTEGNTYYTLLTRDDIAAVQQAAIWYFTNYYKPSTPSYTETNQHDEKYDKTKDTHWLYYTTSDNANTYSSLFDYNKNNHNEGKDRQGQAEVLYKYLIETAKEKAKNYENTSTTNTGAPAKVNTSTLSYEDTGTDYILGPINITEIEGNTIPYTIGLTVKNNENEVTNYKLLKSDKKEEVDKTKIKDLVGQDFYISITKDGITDISKVSISTAINYSNTTLTLWTNGTDGNNTQPVMIPERKNESEEKELTVVSKPFDLALRKYITKINGTDVKNSRVPEIDESTISSEQTATYKHRKDPVTVKTGDKVTYKLTIYNEGEKDGRATKVVDQLPTGLKYSKVISGNFEGSYNDETNTLTLNRKENNVTNLPAYTSGKLTSGEGSETIEIECEVVAVPDKATSKVLTNIAWIEEEIDANGTKITNQSGADRDSEPATKPTANKDNMENYKGKEENQEILSDSNYFYKGQQDDDDFEKLVLMPESFDLKLIKRITAVNNQSVPERIESVDVSNLNKVDSNGEFLVDENSEKYTTAQYKLNKEPVSVKKGDIVTYTFRIYNEGTIDGYASEITEDIPEGLEFLWSEKEDTELDNDNTFTDAEKEAIKFNQSMYWTYADDTLKTIKTDYLSKEHEINNENLIKAFGPNDGSKKEADLKYKEVSVMLKVVSENVTGTIIRNEACISEDTNAKGDPVDDRDSNTEEWKKYEDDEDYDNIILKSFDLALRKFIIAVSDDTTIENDEYLKNSNGFYTRAPQVDTSKLNTTDSQGNVITTATYNHTKEPVEVRKNDIVVYMLRVYNEGEIDGYAAEIKDHLPPYLEFVEGEYNTKYGWSVSDDGRTVTTTYLKDSKINKAVKNESPSREEDTYTLSYKEVPIMCKVVETAPTDEKITNIADITKYLDENKQGVTDRDSEENNVVLPDDNSLPSYKDDETGSYVAGQEDDDDFEKVIIKRFDLALRKFITKIEDKDVTTRIPQVKYEDGKITYEHDKTPMMVQTNNVVIYTIRVFNEGEINGYAKEITDDIPEGLEFLPENNTNTDYRWKMIDEQGNETTDVSKAVKITTDYLSKEQGEERIKEGKEGEITENPNLLKAFNPNEEISETNPDYKDVKVAFKVTEPNSSDRIIINSAQISEDSDENGKDIDDEDSIPNEWNEGEDDQDKEYLQLVEFDLALRKWVTQAIVIENGQTTVTNTGHDAWDDPEQVVKVELNRKKINQVTVKFRYSIRVYNQGDIAGYAKEVTDYVPQGLKFLAEDNPGWTDKGNNVISTRLLENTLLQPGEYADVEVVLTWINSQDNMGVMTNTAEISEDYNEYGVPDKDSEPNNKKPGEDDIDDAPVMLSVSTGQMRIYFTLGFVVLTTIAGGLVLIKRFVL